MTANDTSAGPRAPSQSATLTAAARAMHRDEPPPWLLDDPVASGLAGEPGAAMIERARRLMSVEELAAFSRWVCVRARIAEDAVQQAGKRGVRQYVILGAGLDSFAYRRPRDLNAMTVFEVDHPSSQLWKRGRLADIGITEPSHLVFAPVDFENESLDDGLRAAGFDFAAPAVFSWMGVTMYLTHDAIRATLRVVAACPPSTEIVLTYNLPEALVDDLSRRVTMALQRVVAESGEPFLSKFTPAEIRTLMVGLGFEKIRDLGPEQARLAYLADREAVPIAAAQRVLIATVP